MAAKADKPLRKVLAENLRRYRANRGLSQESLADEAGLHRTFVGAVERSERNISLDNIEKLAGRAGVRLGEITLSPWTIVLVLMIFVGGIILTNDEEIAKIETLLKAKEAEIMEV